MNLAKIGLVLVLVGVMLGLLFSKISPTVQTPQPSPSAVPPVFPAIPPAAKQPTFIIEAYANLKPVYEGEISIVANRTIGEYLAQRGVFFNSTCISVYCTGVNKSLGFYVNNELNAEFEKYIPKNRDKLLIWFVEKS